MTLSLTAAPTLPDLNDPATFNTRALSLFSWMTGTFIDELEAIEASDYFSVQSSPTDTTTNRVMLTGAGGLLRADYGLVIADCDDQTVPTGFYYLNGGATANKPSGISYGVLIVNRMSVTGGTAGQILVASDKTLVRYCAGGTWGNWREIFDNENAVGTVSQSSGVPTGAVIETGSNANGRYMRLADGTQVCWRLASSIAASDTAFTWPAAFVDANYAVNVSTTNNAAQFTGIGSKTATTCVARLWNSSASRVSGNGDIVCFGRWY